MDPSTDVTGEPVTPLLDLGLYAEETDPDRAQALVDGAFGHGYLIHGPDQVRLPGFLDRWSRLGVGPLELHTAPRTVVAVAEDETGAAVVSLGHPVDVDHGLTDPALITRRLLHCLVRDGEQAAVREAAYLGGRWTVLLLTPGRPGTVTAVPDTMGTQPIFWGADVASVTIASSSALVALARGLPPDERAPRLQADARSVRSTGVFFLPGTVTHFEGVRQVAPNCLLRADLSTPGREVHERFWPFEARVETPDVDAVAAGFRDRMREHIGLLSRFGSFAWSLTGGLDSRVTLAAAPDPPPSGTFAFTYFNPRDGVRSPGAAQDVFDANQVAYQMGIPHRVLRWRQAPRDHIFARIHEATHPVSYSSHGAGFAMWADLPHDIVQVQSIGGEIGTVFGRRRSPTPLTPEKMSALWMGDGFEGRAPFTGLFAEYLEHVQLSEERLRGYDHHDVVYWELRLGKWGFTKYLLGDYSHRTLLPFNDRTLIEMMHRLPERDRVAKALYQVILDAEPRVRLPASR